jgi:hypothetical protein
VQEDSGSNEKRMRLRYDGTCRVCGTALPAKAEAIYERTTKTVRCSTHQDAERSQALTPGSEPGPQGPAEEAVDMGTPGASARREFERRSARREARIRTAHPRLGGLIHGLTDDPPSTRAWDVGSLGEERLGHRLNELADDRLRVLHDRRIPGSRANIDHLAVAPTGIYVIDAKKCRGRPHLTVEGGLLRPRVEKLLVGSRNCTPVVDGVIKQVAIVRDLLDSSTPVHGVLCFVEADWPLIGGSSTTRGVEALWPKKLYPKLRSHGPLDAETVAGLHRALAAVLKPA